MEKQRYSPSKEWVGTWYPDDKGNWVEADEKPGYMAKTVHIDNVHATIYRPILSGAERDRVQESVLTALEKFGKAQFRAEHGIAECVS